MPKFYLIDPVAQTVTEQYPGCGLTFQEGIASLLWPDADPKDAVNRKVLGSTPVNSAGDRIITAPADGNHNQPWHLEAGEMTFRGRGVVIAKDAESAPGFALFEYQEQLRWFPGTREPEVVDGDAIRQRQERLESLKDGPLGDLVRSALEDRPAFGQFLGDLGLREVGAQGPTEYVQGLASAAILLIVEAPFEAFFSDLDILVATSMAAAEFRGHSVEEYKDLIRRVTTEPTEQVPGGVSADEPTKLAA